MRARHYFVGLLIFSLASTSHAAETQPYSIESLIERALSTSEQMLSQKARVDEKSDAALQAGAWANPSLAAGIGAKWEQPGIGPVFSVGFSQLFFFPGKQRLRREVLDFDKSLEEIRLSEVEREIAADVIRLAYAYTINQRKMTFAQKRQERFEIIKAYLAGHTFASPEQKTTSLIVKERLRNIAADVERLQGTLNGVLQQLNFYVADKSERVDILVPWFRGRHALDEDIWIERARAGATVLANQRALIRQAAKEQELASKEFLPDLTLSAFYNQETANGTQRIVSLGIEVPLPLLNQNSAGIRSKEHRVKAEQHQQMLKERTIEFQVRKLLAEYEASRRVVRQYPEDTIATLTSNLQAMEREFRKNRVDFLLFLELDVQAAETVNRALDAQLTVAEDIASLFFLSRDQTLLSQLSTF